MKTIEGLKKFDLNCNIFSVYDYEELTINELLCKFFTKINECIEVSNETIDLAHWLVNEGLSIEVVKKLMQWLNDGTIENLINVNIFEDLNKKIDRINSFTVKINEGEELQQAIDRAKEKGAILELQPITYHLTEQIVIDLSKCSVNGNGATLDFSKARNSLECIKITATGVRPYYQNGNFIKNISVIGNRTNGGNDNTLQTAIKIEGENNDFACSHLTLEGLNIHNFNKGIVFGSYTYLVRVNDSDIFYCDECVIFNEGTDCGENISLNNCTLYNSQKAIVNNNQQASIFLKGCSIDYCDFYAIANKGLIFINNTHIEGYGVFEGTINIDQSLLNLLKKDNIFRVANLNDKITISNSVLSCSEGGAVMASGEGIVDFVNCWYEDWVWFFDNDLNRASSTVFGDYLDISINDYLEGRTDKYTCTKGNITEDKDVKVNGSFSYKINKTDNGTLIAQILLPKKYYNSGRFRIKIKAKTDTPNVTIPATIFGCNPILNNKNEYVYNTNYEIQTLHDVCNADGWHTYHFTNKTRVSLPCSHYLINFDLGNLWSGTNIWLDDVEFYEF